MPSNRLDGAWEKVFQSMRHMEALTARLERLYKDASDTARHTFNAKTGQHVFVLPNVPAVPPSVPALIGDILQNLRSALDHLAYQLVLHPKDGGTTPQADANKIQFPIYNDPTKYRDSRIAGADPAAKALIKTMQPFGGKQNDAAWLLRELSNWDKHRLLYLVVHDITPGVHDEGLFDSLWLRDPGPPVKDAELARLALTPTAQDKVDMGFYLSFGLTFGAGPAEGESVKVTINRADAYVRGCIGILRDFVAD